MTLRTTLKTAGVAFALGAVSLVASPAAAADSFYIGGASGGGGVGYAWGNITWTSAKAFYHSAGYSEDDCNGNPGDGYGTSYRFRVTLSSGGQGNSAIAGYDTNGCGNGPTGPWSLSETRTLKITSTVAQVCTTNNGDLCAWVSASSRSYSNPY